MPLVLLAAVAAAPLSAQYGAADGEWRSYAADAGSTKYSPLDQINRQNAGKLRIAWRFKTDNFGPRPDYNMQVTPIVANGVMYAQVGTRRAVAAIDPATGEQLWMWRMDEGKRGAMAPRPGSGGSWRCSWPTPGARWRCPTSTRSASPRPSRAARGGA